MPTPSDAGNGGDSVPAIYPVPEYLIGPYSFQYATEVAEYNTRADRRLKAWIYKSTAGGWYCALYMREEWDKFHGRD